MRGSQGRIRYLVHGVSQEHNNTFVEDDEPKAISRFLFCLISVSPLLLLLYHVASQDIHKLLNLLSISMSPFPF